MKSKTPKVGDIIYVESSSSVSHAIDDFMGGKATVTKVYKDNNRVYVEVAEKPNRGLGWTRMMENKQEKLKKEFGENWDFIDPDDSPEFNTFADEMAGALRYSKALEIAKEYHKNQPYGEHKGENDYYDLHLNKVSETANDIFTEHLDGKREWVLIPAILHDLLEDTDYPREDLVQQFGEYTVSIVDKLNNKTTPDKELYFKNISEDKYAQAVKAADRICNINALGELHDAAKKEKLEKKYSSQMKYFKQYNQFYKIMLEKLDTQFLEKYGIEDKS